MLTITKEELYHMMDRINAHWDRAAVRAAFRELMTEIELTLEAQRDSGG